MQSPRSYERVQRRVFGLAPKGLVAVLAVVALALALVALAAGASGVGALLLISALFLAALYVEQARRRRESSLGRATAAVADQTRALAGLGGASIRTWTRTGHEVAGLRLEARRLERERSQLQYELGGAAYDEDDARVAALRGELHRCAERIDACAHEANRAVARARRRTAEERLAVAATQIRKPGDSG
jgi:hypothetical protein